MDAEVLCDSGRATNYCTKYVAKCETASEPFTDILQIAAVRQNCDRMQLFQKIVMRAFTNRDVSNQCI